MTASAFLGAAVLGRRPVLFDPAFTCGVRHRPTPHIYSPGMPPDGSELQARIEAAELQHRINGEVAAAATAYTALEAEGLSHSQIVDLVMAMSGVDPADVPGLC